MKKTKRFLIVILAMAVLLVNLAPSVQAAKTNPPYCRISYDAALKTNALRYYFYKKNIAQEDSSRLVQFNGKGTIKLGTKEKIITKKHKPGTNPAWISDGSYLVWLETDNSISALEFKTGKIRKIAENVSVLNLNAETMAESVTFKDGTTKSIKALLSANTPAVTPDNGTVTVPSPKPTPSPDKKIKEWTDSTGRHHFKFGKNEVIVDNKNIYLNDYRISELCNAGVRFVGIDSKDRVYLFEDKTVSFYRFKVSNIFKPDKIKFAKGTKLQTVVTNKSGYMTKVVTSSGTFTIKQLVADKTWYPKKNYAMNKKGYCTYYLANSSKTYTLTLKKGKLYLGKKLIAKGITRKTESFGFYKKYIRYVYKGKAWQKKIGSKKKATVWKKNVKKLTYSKKNGEAIGAK